VVSKPQEITMMNTSILSDDQLIKSYTAGNTDAMSMLIDRHKNKVFATISLLIKDKYAAEDIFQDLFIKVIDTLKKDKYAEEGKFVSWMMRIAHNLCMDHFRKLKSRPTITTSDNEDIFSTMNFGVPMADSAITFRQTTNTVRKMIDELPEEQREVIILRHYADMSFKDIASLMNCSVNTALGRMRYGLLNLRKMMTQKKLVLN
jgi:RNA polymerase sigma factor (sigma-70 family)